MTKVTRLTTLLFLGLVMLLTIALPWIITDGWLAELGDALLFIQLAICSPSGIIFGYLIMREFHGEGDDPPRRRRRSEIGPIGTTDRGS